MPIYYFTAPGGGFSTGMLPELTGKHIEDVRRDGIKYREVKITLPQGKEFNYNWTTGEISFDTNGAPLMPGEQVNIVYNVMVNEIDEIDV